MESDEVQRCVQSSYSCFSSRQYKMKPAPEERQAWELVAQPGRAHSWAGIPLLLIGQGDVCPDAVVTTAGQTSLTGQQDVLALVLAE